MNLLWQGIEYFSLENCLVKTNESGAVISSTIVGLYEEKIYKIEYTIKTNIHWETVFAEINCMHNDTIQSIRLEGDGKGNWIHNEVDKFDGCIDIDIPLTPFTNTLPIRRLTLTPGESKDIKVLYCDVLQGKLKVVHQKYTCISATKYHYENVPNDFEATIEVDEHGLVVDYPLLFKRKAAVKANYHS